MIHDTLRHHFFQFFILLKITQKCHKIFHEEFGLPQNEDSFRDNPKFYEFFEALIQSNLEIFLDLLSCVAHRPKNFQLMSEIVEMNNQNKFNTKLLQRAAKTEGGAKVIAELFDLENPLERLSIE